MYYANPKPYAGCVCCYRRQVWEDMRAAAQHNKQQLLAAQGPGLAAFLGAEDCQQQDAQQQLRQQQQQQQHGHSPHGAGQQLQQQYNRQPSRSQAAEDHSRGGLISASRIASAVCAVLGAAVVHLLVTPLCRGVCLSLR
jgi:hypothetical protein